MMLVGLTGVARSGKDTVGQILVEKLGFERRAFADKLRAVALGADPWIAIEFGNHEPGHLDRLSDIVTRDGWERAKEVPDVRRFLQRLGTEGVRDNLGEDTWVNAAMHDLHPLNLSLDKPERVVFTDVRFPNEAEAIRELGGEIWRITRPGYEALNNHVSEVQPYMPDRIIVNDGTLVDLRRTVLSIFTPA